MPRARVIKEPVNIEPVDVAAKPVDNGQTVQVANNVYTEAGKCAVCDMVVYAFVSGDPLNNTIGQKLVVYSRHGHREPPGTFCQAHDPNAAHKNAALPAKLANVGEMYLGQKNSAGL